MTIKMKPLLVGAFLGLMSFGVSGAANAAPVGSLTAAPNAPETIQLAQTMEDDMLRKRNRARNQDGGQMRRGDRDRDGTRLGSRDRDRNDWRNAQRIYSQQDHGRRCSSRNNNCRHFYRGYYYETQWWALPLIIGGAFANSSYDDGRYGSRHVEWCEDRYRSYNPRYNTWVSYGGNVNECVSPYS